MYIQLDHRKEQKNTDIKQNNQVQQMDPYARMGKSEKPNGDFAKGVCFSSMQKDHIVYEGKGKSKQNVMDEMRTKDATFYKNYMAVMASGMSGEDYKKLTEEGIMPERTDAEEAVTIMDYIKAVMAQSGVPIPNLHGGTDLTLEKLTEITGDAGYANALKNAFFEHDLPITFDTVKDVMKSVEQAMSINEVSDHMKLFLLENNLSASIANLYHASHSTMDHASHTPGGFFMDQIHGYYGKKPQDVDMDALAEKIEKIANNAGLPFDDTVKKQANWMLEKGILLTEENLLKLNQIESMKMPPDVDEAMGKIAQALQQGKRAYDTDLSQNGIMDRAEEILGMVHEISEDALKEVIQKEEKLCIRSLSMAQKQIQLTAITDDAHQKMQENHACKQDEFLHARLVLEEIRLKMTVSANISLLKSDYAIETKPLEDLVEQLKMAEKKQVSFNLTLSDDKHALYTDTLEKTAEIKTMPLALVGQISRNAFSLNGVHESGLLLKQSYERAGQSYEALMTMPRKDLGDKLSDAFQNIDDILKEEGFACTQENKRAVRILAYNQMNITKESILEVRQADFELTQLLNKMTPAATLAMIRDGVNPLEESVSNLTSYFTKKEGEFLNQTHRFSKFLYKLDKNKEITKEERESFIGIYRLIRQIEKGDKRAVGTVVSNGQEMSFANLLSAIRTNRTGSIDFSVDDTKGQMVAERSKNSISDQIHSYYQAQAVDMLDHMNPKTMKDAGADLDMTWELFFDQVTKMEKEDDLADEYVKEEYQMLRESLNGQKETIEFLLENEICVTPDHVLAAKELLDNRVGFYRSIKESMKKNPLSTEEETLFEQDVEALLASFSSKETVQSEFESFLSHVSENLENQMLMSETTYLDVKALSLTAKQISLASQMARNESYELPAQIFGELTSVHIHFVHKNKAEGNASAYISIPLSDGKELMADFRLGETKISGYVGCNDKKTEENIREREAEFNDQLLLRTGKKADISIIYSETIMQHAGKHKLGENIKNTEQGSRDSFSQLYQTVQTFLQILKE